MENGKCLKPPTRSSIYHISSRFPTVPFLGATVDVDPGGDQKKMALPVKDMDLSSLQGRLLKNSI